MEDHYPNDAHFNVFERCFVTGVVHIPGGAHPSSMPPAYGWDMKAFKAYADAAKDPGDWSGVADRFVGPDEDAYLNSIGGKEAVAALPLPIF
jgi:glutaconate CoA-transferase subunit A